MENTSSVTFSMEDLESYLNLDDVSMAGMDLLGYFGGNVEPKTEVEEKPACQGSVDGSVCSPAPSSPGSMPGASTFEAQLENVFLDENAMGVEFADQDIVNSQVQELLFVANQVDMDSQTEAADSTTTASPTDMINLVSLEMSPNAVVPTATKAEPIFVFPDSTQMKTPLKAKSVKRRSGGLHTMSDDELIGLSVKDLNKTLQGLPREAVRELKQRRRTLKNRGYAANSREKRNTVKSSLEIQNISLMASVDELRCEVDSLKREMAQLTAENAQIRCERDLLRESQRANAMSPDLFVN